MMRGTERTESYWMASTGAPAGETLAGDMHADVCVVGAGIAGLTTAYLVACEGRSVIVLDKGPIGGGQTQRTTAHLSNAIDDRYFEIERLHGADGARLTAVSHTAAIDRIEAISRGEGIPCEFERRDGYLCLAPEHQRELLERERDACHRAGLIGVEIVPSPVPSLSPAGSLRFPRQAQFHPLRYLYGLAEALQRRNGRLFTDTHVKHIEGGDTAHVETAAGGRVSCSAVVVATNTPINDMVAIHTKQAAYRTYAIAAPLPTGAVPEALYWDTGHPYHYARLQSDEKGGRLLIVGGEDHKTGQEVEVDPDARFLRLQEWARRHFPPMGPVTHAWSGQVLETMDGLAFIGRNPFDAANVFIATGDSGMGLTHGTIAGLLISDLIAGRENPWARLYDPSRKPLRAIGTFARENLNVVGQYGDWLTGSEVGSTDEIPSETGAVVREGLRKIAVYRDAPGDLHRMSATCPHLGGIVHWNSTEATWDCPCHGSRFDCRGKVLTGPAVSDLAVEQEKPAVVGKPAW